MSWGREISPFSHYINKYGNLLVMSDNTIKSTDVNPDNNEKKAPTKKAAAKKASPKVKENTETVVNSGYKVIIFESGASYVSGDTVFTREDNIKELPEQEANRLLEFDNFRLPNTLELEEYLNSREG